ncbi:MAG: pyridine nucleotide-disulfide oxidoreductase [Bacteroidales bacterium 36-12]|nr:MAG: pyridine nucleotide-disulfide oxidoreductase [Bacteroidales bacterium 36-12]
MKLYIGFIFLLIFQSLEAEPFVWLETELFEQKGGWVSDSQFMDQMGSSFLMSHGLGIPVNDASTVVTFPEKGQYHFWVRTRDWIPADLGPGPGLFNVLVNNVVAGPVFGGDGVNEWHWAYGGVVKVDDLKIKVSLKDISGFDGRCDVICFSKKRENLPNGLKELELLRNKSLGITIKPEIHTDFDLLVAGGGVAGICAAVQAARLGLKVALVHNRPVLGGNSSSEVRVSTTGNTFVNKYPSLGRIVREIDNYEAGMGGPAEGYLDQLRWQVVRNEKNIVLFDNMHVVDAKVENNMIKGVYARDIRSFKMHCFEAVLFADCTGDATLGIRAGADYRYGRESKEFANESSAPLKEDNLVMGSSNQWRSELLEKQTDFDVKPWMFKFSDEYHFPMLSSSWNWESGFNNFHTVYQAEEIRDLNMLAIYSNWAYLKSFKREQFGFYKMAELQINAGKRESFRLMGDLVLNENDVVKKIDYPDALVTTDWGIDLHYPDTVNSTYFPGREFIGYAVHPFKQKDIYSFPYRCFYSRNISNLFMAGRNISVTHIALGTVRVQRCTGMMGEAVGIAAYLCKKYDCSPREIYNAYLNELLKFVEKGCL